MKKKKKKWQWGLVPPTKYSALMEQMFKLIDKSPEPISSNMIKAKMGIREERTHRYLQYLELGGKVCALWFYRKTVFGLYRMGPLKYYVTCRDCPLNPCPKRNKKPRQNKNGDDDEPGEITSLCMVCKQGESAGSNEIPTICNAGEQPSERKQFCEKFEIVAED